MNRKNFTMIEIIVVLVLISIVVGLASVNIGSVAKTFTSTSVAANLSQRIQLAMDRITKELTVNKNVNPTVNPVTSSTIGLVGNGRADRIWLINGDIRLRNAGVEYLLLDQVNSLTFEQDGDGIVVVISTVEAPGINFRKKVFARNY